MATYNSAKTLVAALSSLSTQSIELEIIVVDDGSTDETKKILQQFPHLIVLSQPHLGPAIARNFGAKQATGEILLFVDADMTFDPNYARDLIEPILNYSRATAKPEWRSVGTYTIAERVANWNNVWARCWNIQEGWEDKLRFPTPPAGGPPLGTDYRAILKSEFERVGGFDDIGYTDTWTLFNKLGVRPLATHAICYHHNPSSLSAVCRQARWSSKRPYKYGLLGSIYALIRTSLPISIIVGLYKALTRLTPQFFLFKLVYDFGRFVGIIDLGLFGKKSK